MNVSRSKPGAIQNTHSAAKIASSTQLATFTHRHRGPGAGSRSGSRSATSGTELTRSLWPESELRRPDDRHNRARPALEPSVERDQRAIQRRRERDISGVVG